MCEIFISLSIGFSKVYQPVLHLLILNVSSSGVLGFVALVVEQLMQ